MIIKPVLIKIGWLYFKQVHKNLIKDGKLVQYISQNTCFTVFLHSKCNTNMYKDFLQQVNCTYLKWYECEEYNFMPWQTESIRSNLFLNFHFYLIFSYLKLSVPWVFLNIICRISMYKDLLNREIKYMYIIF